MSTSNDGFALWITGLPASGKTSIARRLVVALADIYHVRMIHLESDALRKVLTPDPAYSAKERDWFYGVMLFLGKLLTDNGVSVVLDATGNRRMHREEARHHIERFLEVYVKCPLEVCMSRDPKGIYKKAKRGSSFTVPGLQEPYEEPLEPDVVIESDRLTPEQGCNLVVKKLQQSGWLV